ncbi:MAG TPA: pitrilysin family protein [Longimicrobiaceae bacterium]|nr:pitrilysin family protein [Longimicrobiaceae bacterium]
MKRLLPFTLLFAALPGALGAQARPPSPEFRISYEEETLPNGLKVIYHVDRSAPVAAVDIWYDVGSKHEQPGRTGFAHLFEHMMFMGSRNVGQREHYDLLAEAGTRAGPDANGTTSFDRTNYFEQFSSNYLERALWLEADRMGTLLETLTPEKLDLQRDVVKNERRQSYDNQPYGIWMEKLLSHTFPAGHPYSHSVIGSMADLSAATLDDVRSFFRTYYAPNNAVLAVVGDIDVAEAKRLVRKHFGDIPRGPDAPPLRDASLPAKIGASPREVVDDANAPAPRVYVAYRMPPARDPRAESVQLLASIIGGLQSSALDESLVRRQQIATGVSAFNFGLLDGADLLVVTATGKPGSDPDALERALLAELDRMGQEITSEALGRARATRRFQVVNGLQNMGGFGGRADLLAEAWTYHRDPNWVNTRLAKYDAVTVEGVRALAAERLTPDNRAVVVFVPRKNSPEKVGQ